MRILWVLALSLWSATSGAVGSRDFPRTQDATESRAEPESLPVSPEGNEASALLSQLAVEDQNRELANQRAEDFKILIEHQMELRALFAELRAKEQDFPDALVEKWKPLWSDPLLEVSFKDFSQDSAWLSAQVKRIRGESHRELLGFALNAESTWQEVAPVLSGQRQEVMAQSHGDWSPALARRWKVFTQEVIRIESERQAELAELKSSLYSRGLRIAQKWEKEFKSLPPAMTVEESARAFALLHLYVRGLHLLHVPFGGSIFFPDLILGSKSWGLLVSASGAALGLGVTSATFSPVEGFPGWVTGCTYLMGAAFGMLASTIAGISTLAIPSSTRNDFSQWMFRRKLAKVAPSLRDVRTTTCALLLERSNSAEHP